MRRLSSVVSRRAPGSDGHAIGVAVDTHAKTHLLVPVELALALVVGALREALFRHFRRQFLAKKSIDLTLLFFFTKKATSISV